MTKTIKHHLTDALLMGYSAGTLPEAFDLVVATHISLCDDCRARMHAFDAVGGALLGEGDGAEMSAGALAATLRLIEAEPVAPPPTPPRAVPDEVLPAPLRAYVGGGLDAVKWRRIGGGVCDAVIPVSDEASVRLLKIPGGVEIPDHGHAGQELTMVLSGAFRDEVSRFGRGDIEVADDSLQHTPRAEPGADCICIAATDAPLQFSSILPRIAQRMFRI